jgi:hypothetical protein
MNAGASAIHGKKLSGERIANFEKMSECPALITAQSTSARGGEGKATFNRVNICTNQNETLMKQIHNSQKSIGKSIPAYGFLKS